MITAVKAAGPPEALSNPPALPEPGRPQAASPAAPDLRLTIDVKPEGTELVYTLTDRTTGRIVIQLPRAAVVEMGARPDYTAGDLIGAKA